jgi:hypothetical protein
MLFNTHSNLQGQHSFLSASKSSWLRYEVEDLERAWSRAQAAKRGDELHELAANCIRLGQRLEDVQKTLNMYVNDAIRYRMRPEQVLYWSPNAFGTADAIDFRNCILRVWDLKTGRTKADFDQLLTYVAYFCLEYNGGRLDGIEEIDLRIYQGNAIKQLTPKNTDIVPIIDRLLFFDKLVTEWKMEEMS